MEGSQPKENEIHIPAYVSEEKKRQIVNTTLEEAIQYMMKDKADRKAEQLDLSNRIAALKASIKPKSPRKKDQNGNEIKGDEEAKGVEGVDKDGAKNVENGCEQDQSEGNQNLQGDNMTDDLIEPPYPRPERG